MRNLTIFCGIVAAFLSLAQSANAQYLPAQIHRDKANFVDEHHRVLSDSELIDAIGIDVYEETVIGARKQYNAGRKLLIGGATGVGVGVAVLLGGVVMVGMSGPEHGPDNKVYYEDEDMAVAGGAAILLGSLVTSLGGTALSAGIPLKVIGQSRLNWVENDYNERNYTLHVGAAPHGVGLTLNF